MRLTLVLESSTQMKHLLAFGAIAALGMGVSAAPAEAGTACYSQNGRRICVQRGFNHRAYVAPRYYVPRYYGTRNINVYRGPGGGGAVRVNGPNGSYVRWRR